MAVAFNGSTGYLQWDAGTMPFSAQPFTLLAYIANNGATGNQQCVVAALKADNSTNAYLTVGNAGDSILASKGSSTATKAGASISSSAFKIAAAEFVSNSSRKAYFDGSTSPGADTGTDSGSISAMNRICIGGFNYTSLIFPYSGSIAEVHIIAGSLTPSELDSLKAGTLKPEQMTNWVDGWQLKTASDLTSMGGTRTLTLVGGVTTSALAHPITRASGPTINTQPSNQTVTAPATATFTVTATASGGSLTYQWQRSTNSGGTWANVTTGTGGTTASYTTAATSVSGGNANNGDQYRCQVTDSNGTTTSNAATLTVNAGVTVRARRGSHSTGTRAGSRSI